MELGRRDPEADSWLLAGRGCVAARAVAELHTERRFRTAEARDRCVQGNVEQSVRQLSVWESGILVAGILVK